MVAINKLIPPISLPLVNAQTQQMNGIWYTFFNTFAAQAVTSLTGTGYLANSAGALSLRTFLPNSPAILITNGSGAAGNTTIDVNQAAIQLSNLAGTITYSQLPTASANTILGNYTNTSGPITAIPLGGTLNFVSDSLQTVALTGDVVTSTNSFVTTISANAVSYSKIQKETNNTILGNISGSSAAPEEIALPLVVSHGGSGASSFTAYGPVCGGTTSTGNLQSVSPGTSGQVLTSLGVSSLPTFQNLSAFQVLNIQIFTSSGTYTPTSGMLYCLVREVGGGGGSGGAAGGAGTGAASGGGGSGGYNESFFSAATIGASQTVTIGAAGTAGTSITSGGTGGTTSLGSLLTANGGVGSVNSTASSGGITAGGAGGTTSTGAGIFAIIGQTGSNGINFTATSSYYIPGNGGSNPLGEGALGIAQFANNPSSGGAGTGYGAGASGGGVSGTSSSVLGAAGTKGIMIIYEYCS